MQNSTTQTEYKCECDGLGAIPYYVGNIRYVKDCICKIEKRNRERIVASGLAFKFEECTFENFQTKHDFQKFMLEKAKNFLTSEHNWIYFGGQSGSGKTHICTAICSELIKTKPVLYKKWQDIAQIKFMTDLEERNKQLDILKNKPVLYIDDFFKVKNIGAEKITNADLMIAFEIIDTRLAKKLTTIISSEFSMMELSKIDEAVAGRIAEGATRENYVFINRDEKRNFRQQGFDII